MIIVDNQIISKNVTTREERNYDEMHDTCELVKP